MSVAATIPIHDAGNTFVGALSQTTHSGLFSSREKRILAGICFTAFVLPLAVSFIALRNHSEIATLNANPEQLAQLTPATLSQGSDDLAMAEIFLSRANESLSDPSKSQNYLSQAESLLALTTQTGTKFESLKQQLAQALGKNTEGEASLQRIASPATSSDSLAGQTTSNAKSQTVIMKAGEKEMFVSYDSLDENAQIYLTVAQNRNNEVVYVSKRETGKGFTLASISPLAQDLSITWYEIESQ